MNKYKQFSKAHIVRKYNMCGRKAAYEDKASAYQKGQDSYLCPHCEKWHRTGAKNGIRGKLSGFSLSAIKA
jgi:hypothetical protein